MVSCELRGGFGFGFLFDHHHVFDIDFDANDDFPATANVSSEVWSITISVAYWWYSIMSELKECVRLLK